MAEPKIFNVRKADSNEVVELDGVVIDITESITDAVEKYQVDDLKLFESEGRKLAEALFSSLPGGTIDALLVELLTRKKSGLIVTY